MKETPKRILIGIGLLAVCVGLLVMDEAIQTPIGLLVIVVAAAIGATLELRGLLKGLNLEVQQIPLAAAAVFLFGGMLLYAPNSSHGVFMYFERFALLSIFVLLIALATHALWMQKHPEPLFSRRAKAVVSDPSEAESAGDSAASPSVATTPVEESEASKPEELITPDLLTQGFGGTLLAFVYIWLPAATVFAMGANPTGGMALVLFLIITSRLGADSGAYLIGKKYGKAPFAAHITQGIAEDGSKIGGKKTREGVVGGVVLAVVFASVSWFALPDLFKHLNLAGAIFAGLIVAGVTIHGDLLASAIKRAAGVKDSGKFLPEFGGVLDIVDGLLLAGPALYLILRLNWFN